MNMGGSYRELDSRIILKSALVRIALAPRPPLDLAAHPGGEHCNNGVVPHHYWIGARSICILTTLPHEAALRVEYGRGAENEAPFDPKPCSWGFASLS